jgi:hypothetical protein
MDPDIDRVVADYQREHRDLADARDLVRSAIQALQEVKGDPQRGPHATAGREGPPLSAMLNVLLTPPAWSPYPELIESGQRVFADYGLYEAGALFFASLPMAYATVDGAEVLARVSDLATRNLTRRVAETGQMLLDVMGLRGADSLAPGAAGYMTAIGLRVMHACVRVLILDRPESGPWPEAEYGPPVNQELMLGTLLDFTVVAWEAMARMGIKLSPADRQANLHAWSFIGLLMGVEACRDGALSLSDVEQISAGLTRLLGPSQAGRRLMAALLAEMEEFMPLGWRKLPRSVVRMLFQDAPGAVRGVPDLLSVPPAAWWSVPLLALLRIANQHDWLLGPAAPPVHALIRKLSRHVLISYADRYAQGPTPFHVPGELASRWRIPTSPAGLRVHRMRGRVRDAARARLQRVGGRTRRWRPR